MFLTKYERIRKQIRGDKLKYEFYKNRFDEYEQGKADDVNRTTSAQIESVWALYYKLIYGRNVRHHRF